MNIGLPPKDDNMLNETQSKLSIIWETFFSQLITQLNTIFTNLGFFIPGISNITATKIAPTYQKSIIYNNDNQRMEINNDGTFAGIQTITMGTTAEIQELVEKSGNSGRFYINTDNNHLQYSVDGSTIRTVVSI